jgi:hypothetical protein
MVPSTSMVTIMRAWWKPTGTRWLTTWMPPRLQTRPLDPDGCGGRVRVVRRPAGRAQSGSVGGRQREGDGGRGALSCNG